MEFESDSISLDIAIIPSIASITICSDAFMTDVSLLYRFASCNNTVFIDSSYKIGYYLMIKF